MQTKHPIVKVCNRDREEAILVGETIFETTETETEAKMKMVNSTIEAEATKAETETRKTITRVDQTEMMIETVLPSRMRPATVGANTKKGMESKKSKMTEKQRRRRTQREPRLFYLCQMKPKEERKFFEGCLTVAQAHR